MGIPKRNVAEIRARYELEPDLNDVYLEGIIDKEIFDAALKDTPEIFRPCYAIDDIEVDAELVAKYGLTLGNRQRVIALAGELSLPAETSVRLVVDRDFEDWLPVLPKMNGLVTTKFCDVEAIFFYDTFVKKIMLDASRCKIQDWDKFFGALKTCLCQLFCLRLEIALSDINAGLIDFTRCLTVVDSIPELNIPELIERSLSGFSSKTDRQILIEKVEIRLAALKGEPHQMVSRGHDFVKLVTWCVRATKGLKSLQNEQALVRVLVLFAGSEKDDVLHPIL